MSLSTAARTAGLGKRILPGQLWGAPPSSAIGAPSIDGGEGGLIGLRVELFINSAWTDISPWVYYRDGTTKIPITRGRGDETSQTPPQTATVALNNRDGRFSPRNPTGPYYGQLTKNTPIRISRFNNGVQRFRFYGEVPSWPMSSDISGTDVVTTITAAGMLRRLSQGNKALRSAMFRAYTVNDPTVLPPVAYWPCEDSTSATQIASGLSGGQPMILAGSPTFAADSTFACSASLPTLSGSTWTGPVSYTGGTDNVVRFLMAVPSGGTTNGAVIARFSTSGVVARVDLVYGTGGSLKLVGYDGFGNTLITVGPGAFVVDGNPVRVSMDLIAAGANITCQIQTQAPSGATGGLSGTLSSTAIGTVTKATINPNGTLTDTAIGHVSVQSVWTSLFAMANQVNAWSGEIPTSRFTRLCTEQNVQATFQSYPPYGGDTTLMGYQTLDTFPTLLQQVADTAFLPVYEARDQLALMTRTKSSMYNQAAHLTLDMSAHQLSAPLVPVDDDALIRNDVTVTRNGGSSYEATLTSGANSTQAPPNGVGTYDTNYSISLGSDALLPDQAGWRLHFGTVDEPRYPQVSLNLRHPQFTTNVDLLNAALTLDIGDRIVIRNAPTPDFPPDDISLIVQGYTEVLGTFEHDITFNCTPESPWRVGLLDDTVLGHLDTDGSTLAADYPLGTEGTLSVATTGAATGSPLWTTAAGDFPFDVSIGGERVTVTNITGAASPQTFTVTRSINGITKGQTHGTDVRLWQPLYLSV